MAETRGARSKIFLRFEEAVEQGRRGKALVPSLRDSVPLLAECGTTEVVHFPVVALPNS